MTLASGKGSFRDSSLTIFLGCTIIHKERANSQSPHRALRFVTTFPTRSVFTNRRTVRSSKKEPCRKIWKQVLKHNFSVPYEISFGKIYIE